MRILLLSLVILTGFCFAANQFSPSDVTILGDIDYGQTSPALNCPGEPKFCALVFNANGGDKVELSISGGSGKSLIALADGALNELTRASGNLVFTLPASQEPVTYYAIFRDEAGKASDLKLQLRKLAD